MGALASNWQSVIVVLQLVVATTAIWLFLETSQ